MRNYRNLKEYLNEEWHGIFLSAVIKYTNDMSPDVFSNSRIPNPYAKWVDDVLVTSVYTKLNDKNVTFFITIAATMAFKGHENGKRKNDIETDTKTLYLQLKVSATFDNGFKNIIVESVDAYDNKAKFIMEESRASNFLPYISNENIDLFATEFLKTLCPEALINPMPLPVETITKKLGLNVISRNMREGIFGTIYFNDDLENGVKAGTIFFDNNYDFFGISVGSSNTIIHECVHWFFHRPYFELMKILNPQVNKIECGTLTSISKTQGLYLDKDYTWMEWQANALAPRILMPKDTTLTKYDDFFHFNLLKYKGNLIRVYDETIIDIAEFFRVSKTSAKIRLIQLGKNDLIGFHNFVDGMKTVDYVTTKNHLVANETFSVNFIDAVRISYTNEKLRAALEEKRIIFIAPFFVFNDEKYIIQTDSGKYVLTDYARENMDECCLVFKVKKRSKYDFEDSFYSLSFMSRSDGSDYFDNEIEENSLINGDILSRRISPTAIIIDGVEIEEFILKHRTDNFHDYFLALLEWTEMKDFSDAELARLTLLDNKTISNYRSGRTSPIKLQQVLALCAGLSLEPEIAFDLISKTGLSIPPLTNRVDILYKFLITHCHDTGILFWNEKIEKTDPDFKIP